MKTLAYLYAAGIVVLIILYIFNVNFIWVVGYLLILLLAEIVPRRVLIEGVVAMILLAISLLVAVSRASQYSSLPVSFLLISTGLPGIIVYSIVIVLFQSSKAVSEIAILSSGTVLLLIGLHTAKFILDRILRPMLFIPILNVLILVINLAITLAMSYLVFSHVQALYPAVQGLVNLLVGKI